MERRDYVERLIQQAVRALAAILARRQVGDFDGALQTVRAAKEELLGPLLPVLERFVPESAIAIAGPERTRVYAALLGEEALVLSEGGDAVAAGLCARRAVDLYRALRDASAPLPEEDLRRLALVARRFAL